MYAKSTRPSAKREVQKDRSAQRDDRVLRRAKRDDQIARRRRAQACERSELRAMRMCPRSGQIFLYRFTTMLPVTRATFKFLSFSSFTNQGFIVLPLEIQFFIPFLQFQNLQFFYIIFQQNVLWSQVQNCSFFLVYFYGKFFFLCTVLLDLVYTNFTGSHLQFITFSSWMRRYWFYVKK